MIHHEVRKQLNHSEIEANTWNWRQARENWRQARENACKQITTGFSFTSDWFRITTRSRKSVLTNLRAAIKIRSTVIGQRNY